MQVLVDCCQITHSDINQCTLIQNNTLLTFILAKMFLPKKKQIADFAKIVDYITTICVGIGAKCTV